MAKKRFGLFFWPDAIGSGVKIVQFLVDTEKWPGGPRTELCWLDLSEGASVFPQPWGEVLSDRETCRVVRSTQGMVYPSHVLHKVSIQVISLDVDSWKASKSIGVQSQR